MDIEGIEFMPGVALPLFRSQPHACAYLPGRSASELVALPFDVDDALYESLLERRFRRVGELFYSPSCPQCAECIPIRVPVEEFRPSRSQRRTLRLNSDVSVRLGPLNSDAERYALYLRYQQAQHEGALADDPEQFRRVLCHSPISTFEMSYWLGERLIGVAIVDALPQGLSSVYFYSDPLDGRRSLGTFSGLCEIEECRRRGLAYWHIGFYVRACEKMSYKSRFRPYELLEGTDWRRASG